MTNTKTAESLAEALAGYPGLPITLETSGGIRYALDPESAPYVHDGVLVVPIVEDDDWS